MCTRHEDNAVCTSCAGTAAPMPPPAAAAAAVCHRNKHKNDDSFCKRKFMARLNDGSQASPAMQKAAKRQASGGSGSLEER